MLSSRFYPPRPRSEALPAPSNGARETSNLRHQFSVAQWILRIERRRPHPPATVHVCASIQEDPDVGDRLPGAPEEDQIAATWSLTGSESPGCFQLIARVSGKSDALFREHDLNESRAVETGRRASTPEVGDPGEGPKTTREIDRRLRDGSEIHGIEAAHPAIRQPNAGEPAAKSEPRQPGTQECRHQRSVGTDVRDRHHRLRDPMAGGPLPGVGPARIHRDDGPRLHPAPVAILERLDADPAFTRRTSEDANDLPEEELAAELGCMGRRPAEVGRGDRHDPEGKRSTHSIPEGTSTKRPKPSRSTKTRRR